MIKAKLLSIKKFLTSRSIESEILQKSDEVPFNQLLAVVGVDERERPFILSLRVEESDLSSMDKLFKEPLKPHRYDFLQFFITLPFFFEESAFAETSRAVLLVNQSIEIPGFGIKEADKIIFYQYIMPIIDKKLDERLFLSIINFIMATIEAHLDFLEDVGSGEISVVDKIREALEEDEDKDEPK